MYTCMHALQYSASHEAAERALFSSGKFVSRLKISTQGLNKYKHLTSEESFACKISTCDLSLRNLTQRCQPWASWQSHDVGKVQPKNPNKAECVTLIVVLVANPIVGSICGLVRTNPAFWNSFWNAVYRLRLCQLAAFCWIPDNLSLTRKLKGLESFRMRHVVSNLAGWRIAQHEWWYECYQLLGLNATCTWRDQTPKTKQHSPTHRRIWRKYGTSRGTFR